jgi:hypothetical protein
MRGCLGLSASCVGVCSSRTIAHAGARHGAFLAMGGTERPACRTISACRTRHLDAFRAGCGQGLRSAGEAGLGPGGPSATAGTHIQGQAARPTAMRSGSRRTEAARVRAASAALGPQAHPPDAAADAALGSRRGDAWPAAVARRAARLAPLEAARRRLAARAHADAAAERPRRAEGEAARQRLGRARRGTAPQPVDETPDATAQTPGPAPEWQRRRTNHNGWEYGGKAPARVEAASQLLVACAVPTASHDTQPAAPMARRTGAHLAQASRARPTDATGAAQTLPAPSARGSDSAAAAAAVAQRGCEPSLATGRQRHHASEAEERQPPATAQARRVATGRTPTGRALDARRQVSVAPVCGQSTAARGLRRLLWRGLDHIRGAWPLVCVPPNLRKLWRYPCAPITVSAAAMAP